jgi:CHAT domain-containing protein/tetratricopeptide (TPR) repeat protein
MSQQEPNILEVIVDNTVAVMTNEPQLREEWFDDVRQIRQQAQREGHAQMAALLDAITDLLMGDDVSSIQPTLGGVYELCWKGIVRELTNVNESYQRFAGSSSPEFDELLLALKKFVEAENWSELYSLIVQNPQLLSAEADELLVHVIDAACAEGDEQSISVFENHRALLHRCREIGIEQTFRETSSEDDPSAERLYQALSGVIDADDWTISREIVERNPELLHPEVDDVLQRMQDAAWMQHDEDAVQVFDEYRTLLRRCREAGVERAFAEKAETSRIKVPSEFRADLIHAQDSETQHRKTGDAHYLNEAIQALRSIFTQSRFASAPERFRLAIMADAVRMLLDRYHATGKLVDLDEALSLSSQVVTRTPSDSSNRASRLANLGTGLCDRYARLGTVEDLQQALDAFQEAVSLTPSSSPDLALYLTDLGLALRERYARLGVVDDQQQAITIFQKAIDLTPPESTEWASRLNNLGLGFHDRYFRTGVLGDLQQAIDIWQQAMASVSRSSPESGFILNNLGNGLHERYNYKGMVDDLHEAIGMWKQAIAFTSLDSPVRASRLNNLGLGLHELFVRTGELNDLQQAITTFQEAVDLTSLGSPNRAPYLVSLGIGLHARYGRTKALDDLQQAISAYQEAVSLVPDTSPSRGMYLANLGNGLYDQYANTGSANDLESAIDLYQQACKQGLDTQPEVALRCARFWVRWAMERAAWVEVDQAYRYALRAIEQLQLRQIRRSDKQPHLHEVQSLFSSAAYSRARSGEASQAAIILETGRARLLTEVVERYRADLEYLKMIGHDDLLQRFHAIATRVDQLEDERLGQENLTAGFDRVFEMRTTRDELNTVIAEIQKIPGYESFFNVPTMDRIQRALSETIGVYFTITPWGGSALIVYKGGVKVVWLDLTENETNTWFVKYDGDNIVGGYAFVHGGEALKDVALNDALLLLGDKILKPVAEALKVLGASNVILIPCGQLALFPLHAAEYMVDGQTRRFIDEFTVTYAPSARALGSCRETLATVANQSLTLFGVGNPLPLPEEKYPPLKFARPEVEKIVPLFGEATAVLYEQQATRSAVNEQLGRTTYLHLSCHAMFNPQDPLQSGVVFSNEEMLTLKDLLGGQRLRGTRLVVLSACQTAITDFKDLPEEAIGLPGGFVQAGVPGVVGTLWPVNDLSTMLLMVKFYEAHLKEGLTPASALRKAQLWLRGVTNAELSELFAKYKLTATDRPASTRMAYEMASEKFREYTLRDPNEKPYAHPYYWAPFVFYGV